MHKFLGTIMKLYMISITSMCWGQILSQQSTQ